MARATTNYTVTDAGRDLGKVFVIAEMPSAQAERWAYKALLALMANNADIPTGFESQGMAAMAQVGLQALSGLKWEILEPLLDEMWGCVAFMPDPAKPHVVRKLFEEDIEEVMTRVKLRLAIWALHVDFLKAAAPSLFRATTAASGTVSQNTEMSPQ